MSVYIFPIAWLLIIYGCNCTVGQLDDDKAKADINISRNPIEPQADNGRIADVKVDQNIKEVIHDKKVDEVNKEVNNEERNDEVNKEINNEEKVGEVNKEVNNEEKVGEVNKEVNNEEKVDEVNKEVNNEEKVHELNKEVNNEENVGEVNKEVDNEENVGEVNKKVNNEEKIDDVNKEINNEEKFDETFKEVKNEEKVVEVNNNVNNEEKVDEVVNKVKEDENVDEGTKELKDSSYEKQKDGRRADRSALRMRDENESFLPKPALRIRGGTITEASDFNFPYVAAIIINGKLWCTGAIVDENWILTAAHCLNYVLHVSPMNTLGKYVKVRVGSSKSVDGGTVYEVFGAVRHPKFEEEPVPHADVALLKLTDNMDLDPKLVTVIKLYDHVAEPYYESFILVPGFGANSGSDTHFQVNEQDQNLKSARLRVRNQEYCSAAYQLVNGFQFTEDFFCASFRNGTRDACLFDAGAPAIQRNRLVGIMSFGPERCGDNIMPAVFIKAFFFRDFVRNTIQAYKTTGDLIQAMQSVNSDADHDMEQNPIVVNENPVSDGYQALTAI